MNESAQKDSGLFFLACTESRGIISEMHELLIAIVAGLVVAFLASLLGLSSSNSTVVHGVRVRKSGKVIIIISVLMILAGLSWAGSGQQLYGYTLAGYGVFFFLIGKVVAWFQRL
jgi:xanthosine utilization system XapX-like protein